MTNTLVGSSGYIDPLYMNAGHVSQITDGYALGVTMLVCMTEQRAIVHTNVGDRPLTEICAELLANPVSSTEAAFEAAGIWWPIPIAIEVAQLAAGVICPRRREERTPV